MASEQPYLCEGCPGKGDASVDFDVLGASPFFTADSFKQTRRYRLESADDYANNAELVELSARSLRYFDTEFDEHYEAPGNQSAAWLGVMCAERFLAGDCSKTESEILIESEID